MLLKRSVALFLSLAILLSCTACKKGGTKNADKTINYNLSAEPKTLDPQIASDTPSLIVIQALYEGLVRLDKSDKTFSGVAASWTNNSDSTEFTFNLRKNAKWTDEEKSPVTAHDFVYAFRRALDPQTGSSTCSRMFCIKNAKKVNSGELSPEQLGVTAKDDYTLVVKLEYSYPDFPKLTANAVFMPCNEKFFTSSSGRYGLDRAYILSNGPFQIDGKYGWEHDKYLNLKRSSTYAGEKKPLPSNVDFSIGSKKTDVSDPVAALENSTVDAIAVSASQADKAAAAGCTLTSFEDTTWGLCFNTKSNVMKNLKIRQAFLQSLDRTKVLSHLPENVSPANDIILPSAELSGKNYRSAAGGSFYLKQDANASVTLSQGLKELNLSEMESVTVLCPDDSNAKLMLNEMIVAWNTQFHSYFNMETLSDDALTARVKSGDYQIAVYPVTPENENLFSVLPRFCSNSSDNPAKLSDTKYDALISSAESKNEKDAAAVYASAEKYLNQQAIFYPLYYGKHFYASAKGVTGIVFHAYQGGIDFISAGKE